MTTHVLDTSALLALFWQEPGWERVTEVLESGDHACSAVNLAELVSKFVDSGIPDSEIPILVAALRLNVHPLETASALETGKMRAATRAFGLSLGDRACLTLAKTLQATAITADRPWLRLPPELGIRVECIRPDTN